MSLLDSGKAPVSVVILTKNEARVIKRTVENVVSTFDQVVVVDSGSGDGTCDLAYTAGAETVQFLWDGKYPKKKQWAMELSQLKHDWVLFIDADEMVSPRLASEIMNLDFSSLSKSRVAAFDVDLEYRFDGATLRHGHKVAKRILVDRTRCAFPEFADLDVTNMWEVEGHYQPDCDGSVRRLDGLLVHEDIDPLYDYFARHNRYSDWEAATRQSEALREQVAMRKSFQGKVFDRLPAKPLVFFLYSYLVRGGILDGRAGLNYAIALAFYYWQIGLKSRELNRAHSDGV